LAAEVLQGYGILAQLCPEEQQQEAPLANAGGTSNISSSISSNSNNNSCQRGQEIIYFVRYPNLGARLGFASDAGVATTNNINITHDTILAYQMQKLQEVGYRDIRIVNSVDTTINIKSILFNNNVMATAPAKLVEMTYSTDSAPNETRTGHFLSTATDATARNLGMITGYGIFYEGNSAIAEGTTGSSTSEPPGPVQQVFDSFELIAGPEVEQTIVAALRALVAQAEEPKHAKEKEPADVLTVEIISDSIEGVAPAAFEFDTLITGGTEPYTISWDFGDGSEESNGEGGLLTFNEAGTYTIAVSAIDSTGQTASDNIEVTVEEPPTEGSNQPDLDEPDNNSGSDNLTYMTQAPT
jgi:PKD repeat protein